MDAFERNIIGPTNNIAVEIKKEFLNNGLEIRYSAKEATIEHLNNMNVVRTSTQLQYMELVWATHPSMDDCYPS